MAEATRRFLQEVKRLDGDDVHVLTESSTPKHDDVARRVGCSTSLMCQRV